MQDLYVPNGRRFSAPRGRSYLRTPVQDELLAPVGTQQRHAFTRFQVRVRPPSSPCAASVSTRLNACWLTCRQADVHRECTHSEQIDHTARRQSHARSSTLEYCWCDQGRDA